jgi:hypothetical protein
VAGRLVKRDIKANSAELKLELGLSLAIKKINSFVVKIKTVHASNKEYVNQKGCFITV